jgi:hypothetical protein
VNVLHLVRFQLVSQHTACSRFLAFLAVWL